MVNCEMLGDIKLILVPECVLLLIKYLYVD